MIAGGQRGYLILSRSKATEGKRQKTLFLSIASSANFLAVFIFEFVLIFEVVFICRSSSILRSSLFFTLFYLFEVFFIFDIIFTFRVSSWCAAFSFACYTVLEPSTKSTKSLKKLTGKDSRMDGQDQALTKVTL